MTKAKTKPDNRGGARAGSGPKPQTVSASQLKEAREAVAKVAEKHGKGFYEVCAEWVYDKDIKIDRQQAAWKMLADKIHIQASEGGEADKIVGPAVFLPEKHPRLELIDGGRTKK